MTISASSALSLPLDPLVVVAGPLQDDLQAMMGAPIVLRGTSYCIPLSPLLFSAPFALLSLQISSW